MDKRGRGRRPTYNLDNEACPNSECELYGERGKGNIVSNGTIKSKQGEKRQKFLCKCCGKSFCSRTNTIFYNLRTPEEKILLALKLLVKGMPIRGVADALEVKFDSVSRWLKLAADQSKKLNDVLLKELKVSQIELDALWTFVKKNSLHQRALLWKVKSGSGFRLLKNIG